MKERVTRSQMAPRENIEQTLQPTTRQSDYRNHKTLHMTSYIDSINLDGGKYPIYQW